MKINMNNEPTVKIKQPVRKLYTQQFNGIAKKIFLSSLVLCIFLMPVTAFATEYEVEQHGMFLIDPFVEFEQARINESQIENQEENEYNEVQTTYITTANLNLRPTPGLYDERITLVSAGRTVEVTDFRDGVWFAVNYNGLSGYMYAEFLREAPIPAEVTPGESLAPVEPGTVEMLEWSVVRNLIPQHTSLTVIDVRTGLQFQIMSFSHGNHADVFPVTRDDTETMRRAFGGRWTWEPRPVLVIVGDRTIAASINGMPHGGSGGNTNNGMNGHVCLHFLNSRTHNGNRSHERDHQNAVREAYNSAST